MSDLVINGYQLLEPMTSEKAGFSKWGIAVKNGQTYFLKQLLSPTYPVNEARYSKERLLSKKEFCLQFEIEKKKIFELINQAADGNIVAIDEFFREDSHYYVATKKIDAFEYKPKDTFSDSQRGLICKILAKSISRLHSYGVVHGDLKINNILFSFSTDKQNIIAKLIDFGNSFLKSMPPDKPDIFQIDQIYCAPETYRFIAGEEIQIDEKIDIFALGIVFHYIYTSDLPKINGDSKYIFEAKLNGEEVILSNKLGIGLSQLIKRMLSVEPTLRPSADEVYMELFEIIDKKVIKEKPEPSEPKVENKYTDSKSYVVNGLRMSGSLLRAMERENQKKNNQ